MTDIRTVDLTNLVVGSFYYQEAPDPLVFTTDSVLVVRIDNPDPGAGWSCTLQNGYWSLSVSKVDDTLRSHRFQLDAGSNATSRAFPGSPILIRFSRYDAYHDLPAEYRGYFTFFMHYSVDDGATWTLLDGTGQTDANMSGFYLGVDSPSGAGGVTVPYARGGPYRYGDELPFISYAAGGAGKTDGTPVTEASSGLGEDHRFDAIDQGGGGDGLTYALTGPAGTPYPAYRVAAGQNGGYGAWIMPQDVRCAEFTFNLYLPAPGLRADPDGGFTPFALYAAVRDTASGESQPSTILAVLSMPDQSGSPAGANAPLNVVTYTGNAYGPDAVVPIGTWTAWKLRVELPAGLMHLTITGGGQTLLDADVSLNQQLMADAGRDFAYFYAAIYGNFLGANNVNAQTQYTYLLDQLTARACGPTEEPASPPSEVDYDNSGLPNQDVTAGQNGGDLDEDGQDKDFGCPPRYLVQRSASAPTRLVRLGRARSYRCAILERGGRSLIWDVPERAVAAVSWERRANETSVHTVAITKRSGLLKPLGRVRSWAHEAVVWRVPERGQPQLCAVGPVTGRVEDSDSVTLTFKDLTAWWGKRVIHADYNFSGCTDLTTIARYLINDGMAPDDPNFLQHARYYASGVSVTRSGAAFRLMLDKEISDLTGLGLDWTMTGRQLIVGGELARIWPRVANLTRAHFLTDVEVEEAGAETLTRAFAIGTGTTIGYAGGVDEQMGLLETTASSDAVTDGVTARIAARAALGVAYPSPVYVRVPDGATLSPECPLTVDQLLPGIAVNVEIEGYSFPVGQTQRLTRVAGEWNRDTGERVAVALSPYAGVPADDGSPVGPPDPVEDVETEPDETIYDQASGVVVGTASLPDDGDDVPEEHDDSALEPGAEVGDEGSDEGGQPSDGPDTGADDIGDNPNDSHP